MSTSPASSPRRPATSARSSACPEPAQRRAGSSGRAAPRRAPRAVDGQRQLPPSAVDEDRAVAPLRPPPRRPAGHGRRAVDARACRTASTRTSRTPGSPQQRVAPGERRRDRAAVRGSSRVNVTGRVGRHLVADHHDLRGAGDGVEGAVQQGRARPPRPRPCRRRRAARPRPPASTTASKSTPGVCLPPGQAHPGPPGHTGGMQVALVQEASEPRPGRQPGAAGRAHARGQRPRGVPRGVRPRLRRARLRRQRRTPSRSTGRSRTEVGPGARPSAAPRSWPGCSRPATTPPGRSTPWCVRGAAARRLPQDPPLRLLRLPRVRPAHRRPARRR